MLEEQVNVEENMLDTTLSVCPDESPSSETQEEPLDQKIHELYETMEKLNEIEKKRLDSWIKLQKTKKRCQNFLKFSGITILLAAIVNFHQEMGQVGWNWLQWISTILNSHPEELCGLILVLAAIFLLIIIAKWTIQAAVEDLFGDSVHDLYKR